MLERATWGLRRLLASVRATGVKRILTVFGAEGMHTTRETRMELGTVLDTFVRPPPPNSPQSPFRRRLADSDEGHGLLQVALCLCPSSASV